MRILFLGIETEIVGKEFTNNKGQIYKVLAVSGVKKNGVKAFRIRFLNTGYERDVEKVEIKRGKITDKFERSVFGVGYLGDIKMVNHKRIYSVWSGMLERCYDLNCKNYIRYGGAGVRVDDRWHCFKTFLDDFENIEGYDVKLFEENLLYLDKDIKQKDTPKSKMVYSLETCTLVTREVNMLHRDLSDTKVHFIAISPNGERLFSKGLRPFSEKYKLHRPIIKKCLKGQRSDYDGWKFELVKESNWRQKKSNIKSI